MSNFSLSALALRNRKVPSFAVAAILVILISIVSIPIVAAVDPPKVPPIGTANVDGNDGEWGSGDFFDYLYAGFDKNGQDVVYGAAYIRYDPSTSTVYVRVIKASSVTGVAGADVNWIAISASNNGDTSNKVVTGGSGDNGVPPDFAYIGQSSDGSIQGYEASFTLVPAGTYYITIHLQVQDSTGRGATAGTYLKTVPLQLNTVPEIPIAPTLIAIIACIAALATFSTIRKRSKKA